jgi:hypothetical protein
MLGLTAPVIVTSIVMIIANLQTDKDASDAPPTVAVGASYKIALIITCGILPIANAALVGQGSQWRCGSGSSSSSSGWGSSSGLTCSNPGDLEGIKQAVRKYNNAALRLNKPISGFRADPVDLNNLGEHLDTEKILFTDNNIVDCKSFIPRIEKDTATEILNVKNATYNLKKAAQNVAKASYETKVSGQGPNPMGQPIINRPLNQPIIQAPPNRNPVPVVGTELNQRAPQLTQAQRLQNLQAQGRNLPALGTQSEQQVMRNPFT